MSPYLSFLSRKMSMMTRFLGRPLLGLKPIWRELHPQQRPGADCGAAGSSVGFIGSDRWRELSLEGRRCGGRTVGCPQGVYWAAHNKSTGHPGLHTPPICGQPTFVENATHAQNTNVQTLANHVCNSFHGCSNNIM